MSSIVVITLLVEMSVQEEDEEAAAVPEVLGIPLLEASTAGGVSEVGDGVEEGDREVGVEGTDGISTEPSKPRRLGPASIEYDLLTLAKGEECGTRVTFKME